MLIGVKRRFVFIANSKTASTSIESALTPYAEINRVGSPQRKHIRWQNARREYSFLFNQPRFSPDTFLKFGVVREPADWVRSWYNYRLGNPEVESPIPSELTFEEFWTSDDWIKDLSQKSNFLSKSGDFVFDVVLPQDDLQELFPIICGLLGVDAGLPVENKSSGALKRDDIPVELLNAINSHYQEDYDFYLDWKQRARDVLNELAASSRKDFRVSPNRIAPKNLAQKTYISDCASIPGLIQTAWLDEFPQVSSAGAPVRIAGGVVLSKDNRQQFKLIAEDANGEHQIRWGLASPTIAKNNPENPNAVRARFTVDSVKITCQKPATIYLEHDTGKKEWLFRIALADKTNQL